MMKWDESDELMTKGACIALVSVLIYGTDAVCVGHGIPTNKDFVVQFCAIALALLACGFILKGRRSRQ